MKAWCYYESRLLGAHHGLIYTYALETMVLYNFNLYHAQLYSPLRARPLSARALTNASGVRPLPAHATPSVALSLRRGAAAPAAARRMLPLPQTMQARSRCGCGAERARVRRAASAARRMQGLCSGSNPYADPDPLDAPQVLHKFLEVFSVFDWDRFCLSLRGPIALDSFPNPVGAP